MAASANALRRRADAKVPLMILLASARLMARISAFLPWQICQDRKLGPMSRRDGKCELTARALPLPCRHEPWLKQSNKGARMPASTRKSGGREMGRYGNLAAATLAVVFAAFTGPAQAADPMTLRI